MARKKIRVTQERKGKRVTFLTPDKGKPGKTPKAKQWYEPGIETGWEKEQPPNTRRAKVLRAHKGDELSSAQSLQALANVTTDRETEKRARADAKHLFRLHKQRSPRITPRTPRLRR